MTRAFRPSAAAVFLAAAFVPMLLPAEASAQRRSHRRLPVRPVVVAAAPVTVLAYGRPFYASGGYAGWYSGWYNWYGLPPAHFHGYPYPYPYPRFHRHYTSAARIEVEPRDAEVYVDGYFVGVVDDFDGWLQRLTVLPGERELTIYREGYRTFRQQVLFRPGATLKIEQALEPLAQGQPPEPRPTPVQGAGAPPAPGRRTSPAPARVPDRAGDPSVRVDGAAYGSLAIRVQPADAEVIVDGDAWASPVGDLTLQLARGPHRVEIRKPGYRPYHADVQVQGGQTTTVNVSLSRED